MLFTEQYKMHITETGIVADTQTEDDLNLRDDCRYSDTLRCGNYEHLYYERKRRGKVGRKRKYFLGCNNIPENKFDLKFD